MAGCRVGMPPHCRRAYGGPEGWGMMDPLVLSVVENGAQLPLPGQVDALAGKAKALVSLRRKPAAEKQLALLFWNYPAGEKNLSASHLNVPASIQVITAKLAQAGYVVTAVGEQEMIAAGQAMLGALYGSVSLEDLLARDLAEAFPVRRYTHWLKSLAPARRHAYAHGGDPAAHWAVRTVDGEPCFIIPRLKRGKLVIMPQMPRGRTPSAHYHDTKAPPDHLYMAAYLYVREHADAIVHLGTHGTQEWLPGKDRGLAADDDPFLAVGDVPVFYPYIQDNVGEALQARRRGRAVTVSHQTPPFARQGCTTSCAISITWCTSTRSSTKARHAAKPAQHWRKRLFRPVWRPIWVGRRRMCAGISTVSCLSCTTICMSWRARPCRWACTPSGRPPRRRIGLQPSSSSWASRSTTLSAHRPTNCSQRISRHWNRRRLSGRFRTSAPCRNGSGRHRRWAPGCGCNSAGKLAPFIARARALDSALAAPNEIEALLAGLEGRFVTARGGRDPCENLDVPCGRNLYAFEPDHLPTRAAIDAGREAFESIDPGFSRDHDGAWPEKLASACGVEAVRHLGVTEAQVLQCIRLAPCVGTQRRVRALEIISARELGRPRLDVVVQVTGVYRDQFDGFMRLLADAIERIAALDEQQPRCCQQCAHCRAWVRKHGRGQAPARPVAHLRQRTGCLWYRCARSRLSLHRMAGRCGVGQRFLDSAQLGSAVRHWALHPAQTFLQSN